MLYSPKELSSSLLRKEGRAQQGPFPVTFFVLKAHLQAGNLNDVFTVPRSAWVVFVLTWAISTIGWMC